MQEQVHTIKRFEFFLLKKYILRFIFLMILPIAPFAIKWLLFDTDFVLFFILLLGIVFFVLYLADACKIEYIVVPEVAVTYVNTERKEVT